MSTEHYTGQLYWAWRAGMSGLTAFRLVELRLPKSLPFHFRHSFFLSTFCKRQKDLICPE